MANFFWLSAPAWEWNFLHIILILLSIVCGYFFARRLNLRSRDTASEPDLSTSAPRAPWLTAPRAVLIAAILIGGALRFYGLQFGLPQAFHPDELQKAHFLNRMRNTGSINPEFNLQPPLLLYLSWGITSILRYLSFFPDEPIACNLLAGRIVNIIMGTISIPLLYACGRRIFRSDLTASIAALLLAVCPLHVTNSRYMKEDVLFLTFIMACLLAIFTAVDSKKLRYLYLAGLLAGFSVGSKYTGVVSIALILGSPWLLKPKMELLPNWNWMLHALLASFLIPIGFLLTAPYAIFDPSQIGLILAGFRTESHHAMNGHMGLKISAGSQLWMFHFSRSIIPGLGLIPTVAGLLGVGLALWRWETRGLFVVALVLLFYLPAEWAQSKPPPQPDRYVLACIPFIALLAAEFISSAAGAAQRRSFFLQPMAAALMAAVLPFLNSVAYASEIRNDTRLQMRSWIGQNIPPGKRIMMMGGQVYLPRVPLRYVSMPARKILGSSKEDILKRIDDSGYDYLLISQPSPSRFHVDEPDTGDKRSTASKQLVQIESHYPLVKSFSPYYGQYGFHNPRLFLFDLRSAK